MIDARVADEVLRRRGKSLWPFDRSNAKDAVTRGTEVTGIWFDECPEYLPPSNNSAKEAHSK